MESQDVDEVLEGIAEGLQARVVLAGQRGSRAYGVESADSDHDVVAYLAWPAHDYLRLKPPAPTYGTRKVGNVGVTPFEVRRGIQDALRSNVTLWTVVNSLVIHRDEAGLREGLIELALLGHHDKSALFQYANFTGKGRLKIKDPEVATPRNWLHVLQPLLSFRYVGAHSEPAPVAFAALLEASEDGDLVEASRLVVEMKRSGVGTLPASLAASVLEEACLIAEEARSLDMADRHLDPEMTERGDALAIRVTEAMDPAQDGPRRGWDSRGS